MAHKALVAMLARAPRDAKELDGAEAFTGYALPVLSCAELATLAAVSALTATSVVRNARAEPATWIEVSGPCQLSAADIGRRVDAALGGARALDIRAALRILPRDGGYRSSLEVERGATSLGTKVVTAPTCQEAIDAAVVVLALALTDVNPAPVTVDAVAPTEVVRATPDSRSREMPEPNTSTASPGPVFGRRASDITRDVPARSAAPATSRSGARVGVLTGIDAGTLPTVTPYIDASFLAAVGPVDLRAALRYGLRRVEENVDTAMTARTRRDFGAVELAVCRGAGAALHFSLCAGGELGAIRSERALTEGSTTIDSDDLIPRVAGVLTGRVAPGSWSIQPELEASASAVALGPKGAPAMSFRAGAGLLAQF